MRLVGAGEWTPAVALFAAVTIVKFLFLAPNLYHSTDFEVHRNWLAVTHSLPLKNWYVEDTSEWTLDYPPFFGIFEWVMSQVAVLVDPDLVDIVAQHDPSVEAVWFQRASVIFADATLLLGVMACCGWPGSTGGRGHPLDEKGVASPGAPLLAIAALVMLNSGLIMVDHVHFQYNGFLLGLLLLSLGLIKHDRVLAGGAAFASLLMLKHLFLSLAPIYFVYLLRSYCCTSEHGGSSADSPASDRLGTLAPETPEGVAADRPLQRRAGSGAAAGSASKAVSKGGVEPAAEASGLRGTGMVVTDLSLGRLAALGSVVLIIFGLALGPVCLSDGLGVEDCRRKLSEMAARLFPFGRGLVHAYWAPNLWAMYLFADRVLLAGLKIAGIAGASESVASTTGGLVQTEVMAVLPSVPASLCLLLSLLACAPALVRAWKRAVPTEFVRSVVHCSLSAFLLGFHVHEKALLVPAVVSSLLALESRAGARMYLRLSFLAAFAVFPLLPGPDLRVLKVLLLISHMALATSLLGHRFPRVSKGAFSTVVTAWDRTYVVGAVAVFAYGEMVHPWLFGAGGVFGEGRLPFLPLMAQSVYGALGVGACWGLSLWEMSTPGD